MLMENLLNDKCSTLAVSLRSAAVSRWMSQIFPNLSGAILVMYTMVGVKVVLSDVYGS